MVMDNPTIILGSGILLVLLAVVLLVFYFRALQQDLANDAEMLVNKLRLRLDRLPVIFQVFFELVPEKRGDVLKFAVQRDELWPLEKVNKDLVEKNNAFTSGLKGFLTEASKNPLCVKNPVFLAGMRELETANQQVRVLLANYNYKAKKYNRRVFFPLFFLIPLIFRFHRGVLLEIEV